MDSVIIVKAYAIVTETFPACVGGNIDGLTVSTCQLSVEPKSGVVAVVDYMEIGSRYVLDLDEYFIFAVLESGRSVSRLVVAKMRRTLARTVTNKSAVYIELIACVGADRKLKPVAILRGEAFLEIVEMSGLRSFVREDPSSHKHLREWYITIISRMEKVCNNKVEIFLFICLLNCGLAVG